MTDEPSRKKRGAENQITQDNWEQQEEADDGAEVRVRPRIPQSRNPLAAATIVAPARQAACTEGAGRETRFREYLGNFRGAGGRAGACLPT